MRSEALALGPDRQIYFRADRWKLIPGTTDLTSKQGKGRSRTYDFAEPLALGPKKVQIWHQVAGDVDVLRSMHFMAPFVLEIWPIPCFAYPKNNPRNCL
jgi:hypothetical protein